MTGVLAAVSAIQYGAYRYPSPTPLVGLNYGYSGVPHTAPPTSVAQLPEGLKPIIKALLDATNQAATTLNSLVPQIPAALQSLDPDLKDDIAKVDVIIGKVCDEIIFEATPKYRANQYFTPDTMKAACDYARKVSADIVDSLDKPYVLYQYIHQMNEGVQKLNTALA